MKRIFFFLGAATLLFAQHKPDLGTIHGSLQSDVNYYRADSAIGAQAAREKIRSNSQFQLTYERSNFQTGMRYEAYLNPLFGFPAQYEGQGIAYRFARYKADKFDVTVGNFYEQFGKGTIFRTYQEWYLGIDNSLDGFRVKFMPTEGVKITGIIGKQRSFWQKSQGLVRGADADVWLNDVIPSLDSAKTRVNVGASMISVFQKDEDPSLKLPENVAAFSGRTKIYHGKWMWENEGAYKINNPSAINKNSYNTGNALYSSLSYNQKGLGVTAALKRIDNMDYRSDRNARLNDQMLSFLPATTRQHTWRLPTLYPYATQPNGEFAGQIEVQYKVKKGTKLGGKYGWNIALNYSRANGLDTTHTASFVNDSTTSKAFTYTSSFFGSKKKQYFEDFNVEISKKWSPKLKTTLAYIYLVYNKDIVQFNAPNAGYGTIYSHTIVGEANIQLKEDNALRIEAQHLYTKQDYGSWAMLLAEYSVAPSWYFTAFDEWNYGNPHVEKRVHYPTVAVSYVLGASRLAIGYARQREGLLCVGGICRVVPASNGLTLSLTSSF